MLEPPHPAIRSAALTPAVASSADHRLVSLAVIMSDVPVAVARGAVVIGVAVTAVVLRDPAVDRAVMVHAVMA